MNADMNENFAQKLWNGHLNQWTHSVSTTAEQEVHHEFHEEEPPTSVYFWHVCCAGTGTNGSYGKTVLPQQEAHRLNTCMTM